PRGADAARPLPHRTMAAAAGIARSWTTCERAGQPGRELAAGSRRGHRQRLSAERLVLRCPGAPAHRQSRPLTAVPPPPFPVEPPVQPRRAADHTLVSSAGPALRYEGKSTHYVCDHIAEGAADEDGLE